MTDGRLELAFSSQWLGSTSMVSALAFHPSGWLAVGLGDGSMCHLFGAGEPVRYRCLDGAVRAIAFDIDGSELLVGGTHTGLERLAVLPSQRAPSAVADRRSDIERWDFLEHPPVMSLEPGDILEHRPEIAAPRLAALDDSHRLLRTLARSPLHQASTLHGWSIALAAAQLATAEGDQLSLDFYPLVSSLAVQCIPGFRVQLLKEIVSRIDPGDRVAVVLRHLETPAWKRFEALDPAAVADIVVDMICRWPRGIYSQLKKRSPSHFGASNGYTAKEFWARALELLQFLGPDVVLKLEQTLAKPSVHKKLFQEALSTIRESSG